MAIGAMALAASYAAGPVSGGLILAVECQQTKSKHRCTLHPATRIIHFTEPATISTVFPSRVFGVRPPQSGHHSGPSAYLGFEIAGDR